MNLTTRAKNKLILTSIITGVLALTAIGTSVYLATRPASQSPATSAGEPTPTLFNLPARKIIPTATPIPIPPELPTIFKSFRPETLPEGAGGTDGQEQSGEANTNTDSVEPTVEPEPTLSEDQKQEAIETLDKLNQMPDEFKQEFLQWLSNL